MVQYDYSRANALVAVTNTILRGGVAESLKSAGFGYTSTAGSPDRLIEMMGMTEFDLIVMTSELGAETAVPLLQEIRRGRLGHHPFPLIVTLIARRDYDGVRHVIDGGPDDVLLLPASPAQIMSRIEVMTRMRRRFVVAPGYVGPDRRSSDRTSSAKMIDAPNPLAAKAVNMEKKLWLRKAAEARQPIDRLVRTPAKNDVTAPACRDTARAAGF